VTVETAPARQGLRCIGCHRLERTVDDLYRLVLPDGSSAGALEPWRERGLTIRELVALGVRIEKTCLACQSKDSE
jgi:hypothetical protein